MKSETGTGLYLHIPFCIRKCAYCDFLSGPADAETQERYVQALCAELRYVAAESPDLFADSVYLGGGTPSLLQVQLLDQIFETLHACFDISDQAEVTIEVNPGTVTQELLSFLPGAVNRVSVGVQSLADSELQMLGRIHTAAQAKECLLALQAAGITNISADLIFGLPGQAAEDLLSNLRELCGFPLKHISLYGLQLEAGTPLAAAVENGRLFLPTEEEERAMAHGARNFLEAQGFAQYEISNFAKPGYASRHNRRYWRRLPYLGFGLGAASFFAGERFQNTDMLSDYLASGGKPEKVRGAFHCVSQKEAMEEFCFLGLRENGGISAADFEAQFETPLAEVYGDVLAKHTAAGLMQSDGENLSLTLRGQDLANQVLLDFLLPEEE